MFISNVSSIMNTTDTATYILRCGGAKKPTAKQLGSMYRNNLKNVTAGMAMCSMNRRLINHEIHVN